MPRGFSEPETFTSSMQPWQTSPSVISRQVVRLWPHSFPCMKPELLLAYPHLVISTASTSVRSWRSIKLRSTNSVARQHNKGFNGEVKAFWILLYVHWVPPCVSPCTNDNSLKCRIMLSHSYCYFTFLHILHISHISQLLEAVSMS